MGIQINGTTDTISAVDGSLDINQNATFGNNVTIGGTLTYSDVTNIDSVGLVTAKNGLRIHAGGLDLTSGISTFSDNIQIADKIIHKDDTNTAIRFPATDTFAVETAGDERLRIDSNGYLSFAGDTNTYIWHPQADQLAITKGGGSFPIVRFGTGGNGGTVGFATDSNLVTNSEIIAVRGYSSFKSVNKDYAALYTHNEGGNGSGDKVVHQYFNWSGANRAGFGVETDNATFIMNNGSHLSFRTGSTGLNGTERLHISSDSNITQTIDTDGDGFIITAGSADMKPMLTGISNRGAVNNTIFGISGKWSSNEVGRIAFEAGADTTNKDDGNINLYTRVSGGSLTSRLHIASNGAATFGTGMLPGAAVNIINDNNVETAVDDATNYHLVLKNPNNDTGEAIGLAFAITDTTAKVGAAILHERDAAGSTGSMKFLTRPDNAGPPVLRQQILSNGVTQFTTTGSYDAYTTAENAYQFRHDFTNVVGVWISNTNSSHTKELLRLDSAKTGNSNFDLATFTTGNLGDDQFRFRGDGNAYSDGGFWASGADYAEYFEWTDGNSSDEDRRGMTVVLDGNKVKLSTSSDSTDNIIGVVSASPVVVGDSAYMGWTNKYLRDDYGAYDLNENGERKLNPSYDNTKTYITREDRKEWDTIGMVGKLRIRKGQKTGTRWIKMRDVSSSIEEWLVR